VTTLVIDASIAVKWVVEEEGTPQALALRGRAKLIAPELLVAECANILWKKASRRELTKNEAIFAARLLQAADIELMPTRSLLETATRLALDLGHPAYDCLYIALAVANGYQLVTADESLVRVLERPRNRPLRDRVVLLKEAAGI